MGRDIRITRYGLGPDWIILWICCVVPVGLRGGLGISLVSYYVRLGMLFDIQFLRHVGETENPSEAEGP